VISDRQLVTGFWRSDAGDQVPDTDH